MANSEPVLPTVQNFEAFKTYARGYVVESLAKLDDMPGELQPTNPIKWLIYQALIHAEGRPVEVRVDYVNPEAFPAQPSTVVFASTPGDAGAVRKMFEDRDPYKNTHGPLIGHVGLDWREESERYRREHADCVSLTKLREVVDGANCNVDCMGHCGLSEAVHALVKPVPKAQHFEKVEIAARLLALDVTVTKAERHYSMTIKHIIGPSADVAGFLTAHGDPTHKRDLVLADQGNLYVARNAVLTQIGVQFAAGGMVAAENLHLIVSEPLCRTSFRSATSASASPKPSSPATSPLGPTPFRPEHD